MLRAARENRLSMLAPGILPAEIGNFLWKAVYRARLQPAEARAQYGRFWRACPALVREYVLAGPALALALRHQCSVYDCLYVALAVGTPCDLVTADEKLFNAFSPSIGHLRLLRHWV